MCARGNARGGCGSLRGMGEGGLPEGEGRWKVLKNKDKEKNKGKKRETEEKGIWTIRKKRKEGRRLGKRENDGRRVNGERKATAGK